MMLWFHNDLIFEFLGKQRVQGGGPHHWEEKESKFWALDSCCFQIITFFFKSFSSEVINQEHTHNTEIPRLWTSVPSFSPNRLLGRAWLTDSHARGYSRWIDKPGSTSYRVRSLGTLVLAKIRFSQSDKMTAVCLWLISQTSAAVPPCAVLSQSRGAVVIWGTFMCGKVDRKPSTLDCLEGRPTSLESNSHYKCLLNSWSI